jgi:hypothetical protein
LRVNAPPLKKTFSTSNSLPCLPAKAIEYVTRLPDGTCIFIPKIYFVGPRIGKIKNFYVHLVYFVVICFDLWQFGIVSVWSFVIFSSFLVYCITKNLATLSRICQCYGKRSDRTIGFWLIGRGFFTRAKMIPFIVEIGSTVQRRFTRFKFRGEITSYWWIFFYRDHGTSVHPSSALIINAW